ncbi:hypothetical protein [Nonomuraea helvata]|uniref:Uncharacterized protein n=1 Tax=Nonomuraea helvata TaxID=37484 RepID=A0ABV5SA26_9ACTN
MADVSQWSDPNDAYRAVRAQMARRREEREAEIAAAMARRRR